jgi:hypothetical protein
MSDYHIEEADRQANTFSVVMHIPIPEQDNAVGVSYRDALVAYLGGADAITSDYSGEEAQLKAGALFEQRVVFYSNPQQDLPDKRGAIDALYVEAVSKVQQQMQNRLAYWGYSRDVA